MNNVMTSTRRFIIRLLLVIRRVAALLVGTQNIATAEGDVKDVFTAENGQIIKMAPAKNAPPVILIVRHQPSADTEPQWVSSSSPPIVILQPLVFAQRVPERPVTRHQVRTIS